MITAVNSTLFSKTSIWAESGQLEVIEQVQ